MSEFSNHELQVWRVRDCLDAAVRNEDIAWTISNAIDAMKNGFAEQVSADDRDDLLRLIVKAHSVALTHLPLVEPAHFTHGFAAMADLIVQGAAPFIDGKRQPEAVWTGGARLDIHDRVRLLQARMDIVAREADIAERAERRLANAVAASMLLGGSRPHPELEECPENV